MSPAKSWSTAAWASALVVEVTGPEQVACRVPMAATSTASYAGSATHLDQFSQGGKGAACVAGTDRRTKGTAGTTRTRIPRAKPQPRRPHRGLRPRGRPLTDPGCAISRGVSAHSSESRPRRFAGPRSGSAAERRCRRGRWWPPRATLLPLTSAILRSAQRRAQSPRWVWAPAAASSQALPTRRAACYFARYRWPAAYYFYIDSTGAGPLENPYAAWKYAGRERPRNGEAT